MVALAALVDVPDPVLPGKTVVEAILEQVPASRQRFRKAPDHNFNDGAVVADFLRANRELSLHILHDGNICGEGRDEVFLCRQTKARDFPGAHHRARLFRPHGHTGKLMAPEVRFALLPVGQARHERCRGRCGGP